MPLFLRSLRYDWTVTHDSPQETGEGEATETHDSLAPDVDTPVHGLKGWALMVASGPRSGLYWTVGDEVLAGRDPDATIFLDDVTVSRRHARFELRGGRLFVTDMGSTNGTYVNGTRQEEAELVAGDEVIIGRFRLGVVRGS